MRRRAVDRVSVPPTIHALLAARLDYLELDERAVIEPAAVIGSVFVREAVDYLAAESVAAEVETQLRLAGREAVRP